MAIEWKDPKDKIPPDGTYVSILSYHWKKCWPLSAEIIFGVVESYIDENGERIARVNTDDFTGKGSYCWDFDFYNGLENFISAWTYASDFKRPSFLEHDKHWGEEK